MASNVLARAAKMKDAVFGLGSLAGFLPKSPVETPNDPTTCAVAESVAIDIKGNFNKVSLDASAAASFVAAPTGLNRKGSLKQVEIQRQDVQYRTVAGFVCGTMYYTLVSGLGKLHWAINVAISGFLSACVQGGVCQKLLEGSAEVYVKTTSMLNNLDLQEYEKNFKKNLITDDILQLLTLRDLEHLKIPYGPSLRILDYIHRQNPLEGSAEDLRYVKTISMLNRLGLQEYEKNMKEEVLTDNVLHLLTHSDLEKAKIPRGPSLLMLDHIKREALGVSPHIRPGCTLPGTSNLQNNNDDSSDLDDNDGDFTDVSSDDLSVMPEHC